MARMKKNDNAALVWTAVKMIEIEKCEGDFILGVRRGTSQLYGESVVTKSVSEECEEGHGFLGDNEQRQMIRREGWESSRIALKCVC